MNAPSLVGRGQRWPLNELGCVRGGGIPAFRARSASSRPKIESIGAIVARPRKTNAPPKRGTCHSQANCLAVLLAALAALLATLARLLLLLLTGLRILPALLLSALARLLLLLAALAALLAALTTLLSTLVLILVHVILRVISSRRSTTRRDAQSCVTRCRNQCVI